MTDEPPDAGLLRKYKPITLERPSIQFLPLTCTVVHPIDEASPLWGKTAEHLTREQAEFLILIKAFDDTFFQTVHVRHSYRRGDGVGRARVVPALEADSPAAMIIAVKQLSAIHPTHR